MGRAMIIIVLGLLVSTGYTFMGMSDQRSLLTQQSVNSTTKAMAQNLSHTGVQFAINNYNQDNSWRGPETLTLEEGQVQISLKEVSTDVIEITSDAQMDNATTQHQITATFDASEQEELVPLFNSSLGIATNNFDFNLGGSANINGNDQTGQCEDKAGVSVIDQDSKEEVGTNSRIDGNPNDEAAIDQELDFQAHADLIKQLEDKAETKRLSGNYKGDMGTKDNPGTFFIEDDTKLSGGISEGYGIMVIRQDAQLDYEGDLDIRGNFTFNGLVIFENAYSMDAKGTPTINGSVVIGSTNDQHITVDISGNVQLQYDCTAHQYADMAAKKSLTADRIYKQLSIYE